MSIKKAKVKEERLVPDFHLLFDRFYSFFLKKIGVA
jgi:hypothetical protein